jgi:L-threonylcarbamoyladenylate synthase
LAIIGQDITEAARWLLSGDIVAIPTETVYGLAALADNLQAVHKVFEVKQRPFYDPLILHFHHTDAALFALQDPPNDVITLARHFWPGPLTIVAPKKNHIHDMITAGSHLVAVRVPQHPLTLSLLEQLQQPVAAPSANPFGYVSPTSPEHVQVHLGKHIPYILDGGECRKGIESTIIGFHHQTPEIWRLGMITKEEIESVLGYRISESIQQNSNPKAPGQLLQHYSPSTPLKLVNQQQFKEMLKDMLHSAANRSHHSYHTIGLLCFGHVDQRLHHVVGGMENLSESSNPEEAARGLYKKLRSLDQLHLEKIYACEWPNVGLGRAINDRLIRSSAKK